MINIHRVSVSFIIIVLYFILALLLYYFLLDFIIEGHENGAIYKISSDAPVYFEIAQQYNEFATLNLYYLALVAMPVLIFEYVGGFETYIVFLITLSFVSMLVFRSLFVGKKRILSIFFLLLFPYFLVGPFSLNKEIFTVYSAIFFAAYYIKGNLKFLIFSLLLAFCARSYMVPALLIGWMCVDRLTGIRWRFLLLVLFCLSIFPVVTNINLWGFGDDMLLEGGGVWANFIAFVTRIGFYWAIYLIKYFILLFSKIWSFFVAGLSFSQRPQDALEFIVAVFSISVVFFSLYLRYFFRANKNLPLFHLAFVCPIILMFSDIFHWRYSSFIVVFLLVFIINNIGLEHKGSDRRGSTLDPLASIT